MSNLRKIIFLLIAISLIICNIAFAATNSSVINDDDEDIGNDVSNSADDTNSTDNETSNSLNILSNLVLPIKQIFVCITSHPNHKIK